MENIVLASLADVLLGMLEVLALGARGLPGGVEEHNSRFLLDFQQNFVQIFVIDEPSGGGDGVEAGAEGNLVVAVALLRKLEGILHLIPDDPIPAFAETFLRFLLVAVFFALPFSPLPLVPHLIVLLTTVHSRGQT